MYDELVAVLRRQCAEMDCGNCNTCVKKQAADAIEQLSNAGSAYGRGWTLGYDAGRKESNPRWIPVSERLPEVETYVLILFDTIAGKMQGVCFLYKDDDGNNCWTWLDRLGKNLFDIQPTHWMPLPEPPKEG